MSTLGAEVQSTAVFSVARDASAQKTAVRLGASLARALRKSGRHRAIEPARVLAGDPATREEETLVRARAAFADGRAAYDALRLDDAIARLGQASSLFHDTGPLLDDTSEIEATLAYLGAALTLRGSGDEGESTFVELLTINPNFELPESPPPVLRVFERATRRADDLPTGSIEVYSTPPYAAVYLDGRFEGVTPLTLSEVGSGTHFLRLEKTGYVPHGAAVEITGERTVAHQTRLESVVRGAELRDLVARSALEVTQDGMGAALRDLGRLLAADTLLVVAVDQSGRDSTITGASFDVRAGARLHSERRVLGVEAGDFDREAASFARTLLDSTNPSPGRTATADGSETTRDPGFGFGLVGPGSAPSRLDDAERGAGPSLATGRAALPPATPPEVYLGWVLVGTGGAAVATGTVFGILALAARSDFRKTPQASPDLDHIRSVGETDALVADLCFAGGVLSLAGGIVLLILGTDRQADSDDLFKYTSTAVTPMPGGVAVTVGGAF